MKLTTTLHTFFDHYLTGIKGVNQNTVKAYRDVMKLFLPFAASYHGIQINSLTLDHLSSELIIAFLNHLEDKRRNITNTRNHRLAALKSFAKMLCFLYPHKKELAEKIIRIPQKRVQRKLIGFLYPDEIMKVFRAVDLRKPDGFRDYALLHLMYDSGARAAEIASLKIDYLDQQNSTLAILGKGNHYRIIELWPKTMELLTRYIETYRTTPKPLHQNYIFISQRREEMTRHGVYRICKKYLQAALPEKRLTDINPAHSFRHSCAVRMLSSGCSVAEIRNRLGHEDLQSTTIYLHLDLSRKKHIQKQFLEYIQSSIEIDTKLQELIDWELKEDTLVWLDTL